MRSNKIDNLDLFTQRVNSHYRKHIKTQSKRTLVVIDQSVSVSHPCEESIPVYDGCSGVQYAPVDELSSLPSIGRGMPMPT